MTARPSARSLARSGRPRRQAVPGQPGAYSRSANEICMTPKAAGMREHRLTWAAAERTAEGLSERDRAVMESVGRCRVLTGGQLERLHFSDLQAAHRDRTRRRVLARLTDQFVLTTLERRIGGARAGSTGLVFALGPTGQRLRALTDIASSQTGRNRQPHTPTVRFLQHSLAVSELYVQLVERARAGSLTLRSFRAEPACWWLDDNGGWIKPDAHAVVGNGDIEDGWAIEVDMATESLPTLRRKLRDYLSWVERGVPGPDDGIFPRVLLAVSSTPRRTALRALVADLPVPADALFVVELLDSAVQRIVSSLQEAA
jgi:Replication-relaxation